MEIAILHSGDLETISLGGRDRYIKSLIMYFDDHEITVFGTGQDGKVMIGQRYEKELNGKKYYFVPISTDKIRPLCVFYALNELKWIRRLGEYDCIYAQRIEYTLPLLFSRHNRKVIQMIHGSSRYSEMGFGKKIATIYPIFERMAIKTAEMTLIILNREEFGVPYYKKKYKKYRDKIYYGRNPINTKIYYKKDKNDCREEMGFCNEDKIVMFTGRVVHNPKRVMLYPDICNSLIKRGYKYIFVIIGDGNDRKLLERKIKELNLTEYFRLTGYVDDYNVIKNYLNCADITINISMFEGTCTSVLESLACGVPVISTDVGDIHECLTNSENGIIIRNDNDAQIINDAVEAIIDISTNSIKMNQNYMKYDGFKVANELKILMKRIKNKSSKTNSEEFIKI